MPQHILLPEELPDLTIESLGESMFDSPLKDTSRRFTDDSESVRIYTHNELVEKAIRRLWGRLRHSRLGGPRRKIIL